MVYPILTLLGVWLITGHDGPIEIVLYFPPATSVPERVILGLGLILLVATVVWNYLPIPSQRPFMWRVLRLGAGAGAVAGAVAGAGAFTVAGAAYRRLRLLAFIGVYLLGIAGLVRWLPDLVPINSSPEWTLLVFLGALPLINALFDWLSIGATRYLLTTGLQKSGWWGVTFALIDLLVAVTMLFTLMVTTIAYLEWLNVLSIRAGTGEVIDISGLLDSLKTSPSDPSLFWIYVTIFTTFIPSLVNLFLGGLSLVRGVPGMNRKISKILPADPREMTAKRRIEAALMLAGHNLFAILLAVLLGGLVIAVGLDVLSLIGLNLLETASNVYEWISAFSRT